MVSFLRAAWWWPSGALCLPSAHVWMGLGEHPDPSCCVFGAGMLALCTPLPSVRGTGLLLSIHASIQQISTKHLFARDHSNHWGYDSGLRHMWLLHLAMPCWILRLVLGCGDGGIVVGGVRLLRFSTHWSLCPSWVLAQGPATAHHGLLQS